MAIYTIIRVYEMPAESMEQATSMKTPALFRKCAANPPK
jgi:hypothetical protein